MWLPPPDPRSLCPLSSTDFVEPLPPNKIPGYATVKNCHHQLIQSVTLSLAVPYCNDAAGFVLHNLQSVISTISITSKSKQFVRHDTAEGVSSRNLGMENWFQFLACLCGICVALNVAGTGIPPSVSLHHCFVYFCHYKDV